MESLLDRAPLLAIGDLGPAQQDSAAKESRNRPKLRYRTIVAEGIPKGFRWDAPGMVAPRGRKLMAGKGVLPFLKRHAGNRGKKWTARGEG